MSNETIHEAFNNKKVWHRVVTAWNNYVSHAKGRLTELVCKATPYTRDERDEFDHQVNIIKIDAMLDDYKTDMFGGKMYKVIALYLQERVNRQEYAGCIHRDIDRYARKIGPSLLMERVARWYEKNPHRIVDWSDWRCYLDKWKR